MWPLVHHKHIAETTFESRLVSKRITRNPPHLKRAIMRSMMCD